MPTIRKRLRRKGSALLAVLWLSAALSAIAFSLASTVRGEIERTATSVDGVRSYYLATGALERALLYMQWGPQHSLPGGESRYYSRWTTQLRLSFPSGDALVEILPEASKLNLNTAPPDELHRLLVALGVGPEEADGIVTAIMDWRSPQEGPTLFDQYYLSLVPSFQPRHASFEEIEELLLVKGMTPELFYGYYESGPEGQLVPRGGLRDCVSVYGTSRALDVNTAQPAVLLAIGLSPDAVAAIVEARRAMPFRNMQRLTEIGMSAGPEPQRLGIGGNTMYTLRSTARLRLSNGELSDLRRSVAALVKFESMRSARPPEILRWYDNVWVQ